MNKNESLLNDNKILQERIKKLEEEIQILKNANSTKNGDTVKVPEEMRSFFDDAETLIGNYFQNMSFDPQNASIDIGGERYVLMRASSLTIDFYNKIKLLYANKGDEEAIKIGRNFLFDISHVIGLQDAKYIHGKLDLKSPLLKMAAGPVHFAYAGWSSVEILEANPTKDENFYLKYNHPHSFEADTWIKNNRESRSPVCIMNAGYSSGWCEQSYGVQLTAVEITCRAKGDENCTFIMAPTNKIQSIIEQEESKINKSFKYEIPLFFEREKIQIEIKKSLKEKSLLLKEIHHRVKNNLQLISSLINLQAHYITDEESLKMFNETKNRIKAIAVVHEKLHQTSGVDFVFLGDYLSSIIDLLKGTLSDEGICISIDSDSKIELEIEKAIPCGLIVNELIYNAIKYAFVHEDIDNPSIHIEVKKNNGGFRIEVNDNGVGFPADFLEILNDDSLGFEIVTSLVEQLNGTIHYFNNNGANIILKF